MFIICISSSIGYIFIPVKLTAKWKIHMDEILSSYSLQRNYINKSCIFPKIYYDAEFQDPILSASRLAPTS